MQSRVESTSDMAFLSPVYISSQLRTSPSVCLNSRHFIARSNHARLSTQAQSHISHIQPYPFSSPCPGSSRILILLDHSLRVEDNPALVSAARASSLPGGTLLPAVLGTSAAHPAAQELCARLRSMGSDLVVMRSASDIAGACKELGLGAVYINHAVHQKDVVAQEDLLKELSATGIETKAFWGNTLTEPDVASNCGVLQYRKHVVGDVRNVVKVLAAPESLAPLPKDAQKVGGGLLPAMGRGTSAARRVLSGMSKRMEMLSVRSGTAIATKLRHLLDVGAISPRMVASHVVQVVGKLEGYTFSEMVWRSHLAFAAHRKVAAQSRVGASA